MKKIIFLFFIIIILFPLFAIGAGKRIFVEKFHYQQTLPEAGRMSESTHKYWWVNSGAYFYFVNGVGKTVMGNLPKNNKWRTLYSKTNPGETDNGYHPQNIFRLVLKSRWKNIQQEAYFKITNYHLSRNYYRNESNGLLLFNRYQDGNNLYYAVISPSYTEPVS
jgi:hypothetical protein